MGQVADTRTPPCAPAPDATLAYGPHPRQFAEVWMPRGAEGRHCGDAGSRCPLAIMVHGGSWTHGDPYYELQSTLAECGKRGVVYATLHYRFLQDAAADGVSPPVRYPMEDILAAVGLLMARAEEFGADPSRVLLFGGSAGACSALHVALRNDCELGVKVLFVEVPQTSMDPAEVAEWIPNTTYGGHAFGYGDFKTFLAEREKWREWIDRYSPSSLVRRCTPGRVPPIYFRANPLPPPGEFPKDTPHAGMYCVKFREICDSLGVECRPGSLCDALDRLVGSGVEA